MIIYIKQILPAYLFLIISACTFSVSAQEIAENARVYLEFEKVDKEVNVNGRDALGMFESYIEGYSDLEVVTDKEASEITFVLFVFEKNFGYRRGKINVLNSNSGDLIYDTGWVKGMPLVFYGYSGTRHAIARAFIDEFLEEYPHINQKK